MALIEPGLLRDLGIRLTGYRVPIPLYMKVVSSGSDLITLTPEILSRQEVTALLLQIEDHVQFSRFITMPLLVPTRGRSSGPASRTVFAVDPRSRIPLLRYDPRFRAELSSVYSKLFFLHQHALVTSEQESRPLLSYFDQEAYLFAKQLYPDPMSPLDDLDACDHYTVQRWKQVYEQANLI